MEVTQIDYSIELVFAQARRYEKVRRMTAAQFAELWRRNLEEGVPFDDLVDQFETA